MNNQNNQQSVELIIARGISKKPTRDGSKQITRLFFDNESIQKLLEQAAIALQTGQDGVSITLLEGEGKKGPYGMVSFQGLEKRDEGQPYQGQKKAYAPKPQAAAAPVQGGYKPKTPAYGKGFNK